MANSKSISNYEGLAINRAPFFEGEDYLYWKTRMTAFLKSESIDVWKIVSEGPFKAQIEVNGVLIDKPMEEWNEHDKRLESYNHKAVHILFCALSRHQFNKVQSCQTAHDIWHTLEITYEGTSQVKENKASLLVHQYELFKMKPPESIQEMFDRFNDIINGLKALGKTYTHSELVRKILRSLPKNWSPIKTAIQEAKDLSTLPLENLMGSLLTHEMSMREEEEDQAEKKKTIALKVTTPQNNDESDEEEDDDLAMLAKFKKFLKKERKFRKNYKKDFGKGEFKKKENDITCFECKKSGHIKAECPLLKYKNKKVKKKAMVATWSDSEISSDEEEEEKEVANLCFMAWENKSEDQEEQETENEAAYSCFMALEDVEEEEENDEVSESLSYNELYDAFESLLGEYKKIGLKNVDLKKQVSALKNDLKNCHKDNDDLKTRLDLSNEEIDKLKIDKKGLVEKVENLTLISSKLTQGKDNLDKILGSQRYTLSKNGVGYGMNDLQKNDKANLVKISHSSFPRCTHCKKYGHIVSICYYRNTKIKQVWVPKGTILPNMLKSNQLGPKKVWVPKSTF